MPKLVIHLGLAKTGTTSLQKFFFPQVHGYLGKTYAGVTNLELSEELTAVTRSLKSLWQEGGDPESLSKWGSELGFDEFPTILISDETLSRWRESPGKPSSSWPVQKPARGEKPRRGSHPIIAFLATLQSALPPTVELITVLTVRAQKTYLPSHASQARQQSMGPIVRRILRRKDVFILWDRLVADLVRLRGPRSHLTLLFEDGIEHNAREIVRFCGLRPANDSFQYGDIHYANKRQEDQNSWHRRPPKARPRALPATLRWFSQLIPRPVRLVLGKTHISPHQNLTSLARTVLTRGSKNLSLTKHQASKIDRYTSDSNSALSVALGRDLSSLGY